MEKENAGDAVSIHPRKTILLPLSKVENPQKQCDKQSYHQQAPHPSMLLANGAEDEVGTLFGHEIEFSLSAFQKALAEKTATPNRDFGLSDIPPKTQRIGVRIDQGFNPVLLVRFKHITHDVVHTFNYPAD